MADRIAVERVGDDSFRVVVSERASQSEHTVSLDDAYRARLAGGVPAEELIRRSFEFLLEREPKESILRSFALPVIGRYFPEYEEEMKRRLRA